MNPNASKVVLIALNKKYVKGIQSQFLFLMQKSFLYAKITVSQK